MAYRETGVTQMLMGNRKGKKLQKPDFEVSVYAPVRGDVSIDNDNKWLKKDLQRENESVAKYEKILETRVPEEVAAKAKEQVEQKLAECKLRARELKGRLKLRSKEGK